MPRLPEIGNVQLYPSRPLNKRDKNGYVLKFYCPIRQTRVRKNCGTRDRREARRIMRECRERLLNGRYLESGGAITEAREDVRTQIRGIVGHVVGTETERTWTECLEEYKSKHAKRTRPKSHADAMSRLDMAGRILEGQRQDMGLAPGGTIEEFTTLDAMEYLQDRLLDGDEGLYDYRAPTTVNSMMGATMAFIRFCRKHRWIKEVPPLDELPADDVMKGRPITMGEFETLRNATLEVVGHGSADSWERVLNVLWESAFRIGDAMDFAWTAQHHIHPVWPNVATQFPTLAIPASQKNRKRQIIPMLPGLQQLLEETPNSEREDWIVNPQPIEYEIRSDRQWFQPTEEDLAELAATYNNTAIARACGVSDTTIRKWLVKANITRRAEFDRYHGSIDSNTVDAIRQAAESRNARSAQRNQGRLSKERVSRVIALIGKSAEIVVQEPDTERGKRLKFASAHDIRRGCAKRLIDLGVSAETLKLVLRHRDFATTERYYGATRDAQAAAAEIREVASRDRSQPPSLSTEEMRKLRDLLAAV